MRPPFRFTALGLILFITSGFAQTASPPPVLLPAPEFSGRKSLEQTLAERRSMREFSKQPLTLEQLGQMLWAGQGITSPEGYRTAPSAGALYPLELYAVVQRVETLEPGVYHYRPDLQRGIHWLEPIKIGDPSAELNLAAFDRATVGDGAVAFVFTAVIERSARKYGDRAYRYTLLEAGHAAQNILLQAESLSLAAVPVGSFDDAALKELVGGPGDPVYIISAGRRRN